MNEVTETFLRMERVFHEALEAPPEARAALVERGCEGDAELMAEVRQLLEASELEERFTTASRQRTLTGEDTLPERRRIGPYELDRLLGRGGMGAVYLAHRVDGEFEQQVAVKLIDMPLATDFFREQFRRERQILAGLQHPYIARLLDGGVTSEGDLYLAMEYVDGVPIHRYAEQKRLTIRQRLELFRSVCEAVQFAHQSLVVHRDLKPDNIFVAEDGKPKLLDFGTAKLISPTLEKQEGEYTRHGFQSFTPQYASPEQVLGQPITTASDAYSLGVLLYMLLTGNLPYELKEATTAEMVRVICQEPPRKPVIASGCSAGKGGERLDADLEAILSKALRKEPLERYRTAEQLASDVQSFLDGQPVEARRGTVRYKLGKFALRNRLGIAAAAVLALTLIAGVVGVLWQARVANEERRKAEARSEDLRQLSNSLLSELDEAIKELPGSTGAQKLLVMRVLEHLDRMAADARKDVQGDRQTALDLIDAYTRLGNLQGNGYDQNLGDRMGALASLGKALVLAKPLVAAHPEDKDALRALATVEQSRSEILYQEGQTVESVAALREAIAHFDVVIADPHTPAPLLGEAASAYGSLGDQLGAPGTPSLGDRPGAILWYKKTIDLDHRALQMDPHFLRAQRGLAIMQMKLGQVEVFSDPALAIEDYRAAMRQTDALPASQQSTLYILRLRANLLRKQANALSEMEEFAAAKPLYDQVIWSQEKLADDDPQDARAQFDLAIDLSDQADSEKNAVDLKLRAGPALKRLASPGPAEVETLRSAVGQLQQAAEILDQIRPQDPANTSWLAELGKVLVQLGSIQAMIPGEQVSEARTERGLTMLRDLAKVEGAPPSLLDQAADAFLEAEPARLRDAKFALDCAQREVAVSHRTASEYMLTLAQAYRANGEVEKAHATAREGLALLSALPARSARMYVKDRLEREAKD